MTLFAGILLVSSRASQAGITWTNLNGGNWSAATNWSPNQVPVSTDDAIITNAGTYTVTLDASPTVNSLTLGGGGGQETLSTAGYTLTLNSASAVTNSGILALSGGALAGPGLLTVSGQLDWTGGNINNGFILNVTGNGVMVVAGGSGNPNMYEEGIITNAGTLQLVSGTLVLYSCGAVGELINLPGGLVELTADVSIAADCGGEFVNLGTLVKSGGTGTSTVEPAFINSGTVEANTGTISILGSANLNPGSLFMGTGQTALSSSTVTLNGSLTSSNLVLAGANLAGNAVLNGVLTWTGGEILGNCALTVASNSVLVLAGVNGNDYYDGGDDHQCGNGAIGERQS